MAPASIRDYQRKGKEGRIYLDLKDTATRRSWSILGKYVVPAKSSIDDLDRAYDLLRLPGGDRGKKREDDA